MTKIIKATGCAKSVAKMQLEVPLIQWTTTIQRQLIRIEYIATTEVLVQTAIATVMMTTIAVQAPTMDWNRARATRAAARPASAQEPAAGQ